MSHDLTIDNVFKHMFSCDERFINEMAKAAFQNHLEIAMDMEVDLPLTEPAPTIPQLQAAAAAMTDDAIAEFRKRLVESIRALHITGYIKVQRRTIPKLSVENGR